MRQWVSLDATRVGGPGQNGGMLSIVYSSNAAGDVTESDLAELLAVCRANNDRLGLTGMLLFRDRRFIQVLEGPDDVVKERMAVIEADERHTDIRILLKDTESDRQFPEWTMGYEAVTERMADDIPGYRSTFDDLADDGDDSTILPAVRQLVRWFQARSARSA